MPTLPLPFLKSPICPDKLPFTLMLETFIPSDSTEETIFSLSLTLVTVKFSLAPTLIIGKQSTAIPIETTALHLFLKFKL
jgi:hypothetical protein